MQLGARLHYNCGVRKSIYLSVALALLLSACGLSASPLGGATPTLFVITSTLPPTPIPSATLTPIPPTLTPTTVPIDGMTTTQVNVRDAPSAGGSQLGILAPFLKVQIVGQDSAGAWYEILYPQGVGGVGWVTAQYINVQKKDSIPVIGAPIITETPENVTGTPSASGTIIQQVNVRKGPGTDFDALGTLNAKETAALIGKDPSGSWLQIQYTGAADGKGWIAATYVQAPGGIQGLPVIGGTAVAVITGTPDKATPAISATPAIASPDNDSAQAPAANVAFSPQGTRALLYSSELSAPQGDAEDFVAFSPYSGNTLISLSCTGNGLLRTDLDLHGTTLADWGGLACGDTRILSLGPAEQYVLRLSIAAGSYPVFVHYNLRIEDIG